VDTQPSRSTLEDAWRERVNRARTQYERTAAICAELLAERMLAFPAQPTPDPDGTLTLRHALRRETEALNEYMRVLRIYTDLHVHGVVPEEHPAAGPTQNFTGSDR
jgi:hypothetical protein